MISPLVHTTLKGSGDVNKGSKNDENKHSGLHKPFKVPLPSNNPNNSDSPASFDQDTEFDTSSARFRIVHDPGPYPISSGLRLTKDEMLYGLLYNSFTDGTIMMDVITSKFHRVVIKNDFKLIGTSGMGFRLKSKLVPPHPLIKHRSNS
jgi:hypothetical protein